MQIFSGYVKNLILRAKRLTLYLFQFKDEKRFLQDIELRTVYINVAPDSVKMPDFPANSSIQTKAEFDYLIRLQETRTPGMIEMQSKS